MRFVQKWSFACANHLAIAMKENHNKRSIYYYGFFIVIGALTKGIILISVAALLGVVVPTVITVFAFSSLRMLAGGYHMDTFGRCLFISMALFIIAALTAKYTYLYWNLIEIIILIVATFLIGLYVLRRYAPKDTPNKPITDPIQIRKFKKLSITYLIILTTINSFLTVFELKMYILALSFGILLELFTVTPTGHKFFNVIKNGLDYQKNKQKSCNV